MTRFGGTDVAVFTWSIVRARARDTISAGRMLTHTPALHPHAEGIKYGGNKHNAPYTHT